MASDTTLLPFHRPPERLVVVTGPPRSGTTIVGEVLGYAARAATIHEPMNPNTGDRAISMPFEIPGTDGISDYAFALLVDRLLHRRLKLRTGAFKGEPAWRRAIKLVTGGRTVMSQRRALLAGAIDTLIWKDPFAMFAAGAIARQVPWAQTVICYRPALATAASFKRMKWRFDHHALARRLGIDALDTFFPAGADVASPAFGAAILWKLSFERMLSDSRSPLGQSQHLFDIDDAIADPVGAYARLYDQCGLDFTSAVEARVAERYRQDDAAPELAEGTAHVRNRDMGDINSYWSRVLDAEEVALIQALCGPIEEEIAATRSAAGRAVTTKRGTATLEPAGR